MCRSHGFNPRFLFAVGLTRDSGMLLVSPTIWVAVILPTIFERCGESVFLPFRTVHVCFLLPYSGTVYSCHRFHCESVIVDCHTCWLSLPRLCWEFCFLIHCGLCKVATIFIVKLGC